MKRLHLLSCEIIRKTDRDQTCECPDALESPKEMLAALNAIATALQGAKYGTHRTDCPCAKNCNNACSCRDTWLDEAIGIVDDIIS